MNQEEADALEQKIRKYRKVEKELSAIDSLLNQPTRLSINGEGFRADFTVSMEPHVVTEHFVGRLESLLRDVRDHHLKTREEL